MDYTTKLSQTSDGERASKMPRTLAYLLDRYALGGVVHGLPRRTELRPPIVLRTTEQAYSRVGRYGVPPFLFSASNSSNVRGQSSRRRRESERSASNLPPVWHCGQ